MSSKYAWTERNYGGSWSLSCERGPYTARVWMIVAYGRTVFRWDVRDDRDTYAAAEERTVNGAKAAAEQRLWTLENR